MKRAGTVIIQRKLKVSFIRNLFDESAGIVFFVDLPDSLRPKRLVVFNN